ncbi:hypothetical protein ACH5RR_022667 [Cinchona calisaya]|uniref:Zinc finger CCCH domain-containing protein 5 n=1 Tax=Cinchona calisaya TaxID=153742 RepID=A0ABD2Z8G4_9GENT
MTEQSETAMAEEEQEQVEEATEDTKLSSEPSSAAAAAAAANVCRKERRKASKKEKRKQKRKEAAEKERQEEEARLNDPEEQLLIQLVEEREKERVERERREFEEKERLFLEGLARKKAQEEEEEEQRRVMMEEEQKLKKDQVGLETEANDEEEWEYVEEGPPEIIWQGNEIIVKKNKVRVRKKDADEQKWKEDPNRPISNPLPPQSEAFTDFKSTSMLSAQQLLENVAQQIPNFGTEQDKAHCPFHLKTGACRFGSRCSRVHFYPDKSCTLLIKNMYNGPGLAWEQDEGLEYTEEEVELSFEEFYEDVHTEFLKFGELVNFKVSRNGSYHLRGNVYVHYQSLDSAVLAYSSINGRYFAGKQVNCEFVGVTRWKVAICGEYMKSKLKTCSRGTACNFIHCFRNPGGDYEWADWEKPPPKYWVKRMAALFGYSHESVYDKWVEQVTPGQHRNSRKRLTADEERYHFRRSLSREMKCSNRSPRDHYKDEFRRTKYRERHMGDETKGPEVLDEREREEERHSRSYHRGKKRHYDSESERYWSDGDRDADGYNHSRRKSSRSHHSSRSQSHDCRDTERGKFPEKISRKQKVLSGTANDSDYNKEGSNSTDSSRDFSHENRDCVSSEDLLHRKKRPLDSDSAGDWSDGIVESHLVQTRKFSRHADEVAGLSKDYQELGKSLHDKFHQKGSEQTKLGLHKGRKNTSSGKRDHSSRKTREVDHPDEHEDTGTRGHRESEKVDAREHHEHNHSSRKTREADYADDHDEDIDKRGRWEPEKVDAREGHKHDYSRRKMREADFDDEHDEDIDERGRWEPEKVDTREHHKHNYSRRKMREADYDNEHDVDIDKRGRWEPEKVDTREHRKHRRKSHDKSGSYDLIIDGHSRESRSKSKSRSSSQKRKTYSSQWDSDEQVISFGWQLTLWSLQWDVFELAV